MFKPTLESVISIDTDKEILHLYSMKNGDKNSINYFVVNYKARAFDKEFFEKIGNILRQYKENYPTVPLHRVSLILPDTACLLDTITVPTMQKRMMDNSLNVTLANLYKNSAAIRFNRFIVSQNKQQATYGIVGLRREIIGGLTEAFSANSAGISNITYASNAAVNGAMMLNPKLKNASYMLLDIKENSARIVFVVKGKTMGAYTLPFGYAVLSDSAVIPEDLLFDYPVADLAVLNAKERAKAKALTVSEPKKVVDDDDDDDDDEISVFSSATTELPAFINTDKKARKLPKYMLRPTPESSEGFVCENFRLFVKWTLEVFAANTAIASFAHIDHVYVNMPTKFNFVYPAVNAELAENKLSFHPLTEEHGDDLIYKNLELYGGFYAKQYNKPNSFPVFKNLERYGNLFAKPSSPEVTEKHVGLFGKRETSNAEKSGGLLARLTRHETPAGAEKTEKHSFFGKHEKTEGAEKGEKHSLFGKHDKAQSNEKPKHDKHDKKDNSKKK